MKKVLIILCIASSLGHSQQLYRQTFSSGFTNSQCGISMPGEAFNNIYSIDNLTVVESILYASLLDESLSVNEILDQSRITLFPNPVSERLFIKGENINTSTKIAIYDNLGRLAIKGNISLNGIDISNLSSGLYQVIIYQNNNKQHKQKIVKK